MKTVLQSMIIILTIAAALSADSPKQLNQEGLDLYRAGKYGQAVKKFRKAVEINPRYGWAYYNLACTLGVIRKKGNICEHGAFQDRIVEYLTKAVKYQPVIKRKFKKDHDLDSIRKTIGYQKLLGLTLTNPGHIKLLLQRVTTWYGPAPGAYGHTSAFSFKKSGSVMYWYLRITPEGHTAKVHLKGTWRFEGSSIIVVFNKPLQNKKIYKGKLDKNGRLSFDGIYGFYLDTPDECSA